MTASRKVLLIGWDAADWKVIRPLMNAGRMPNVQRMVERGASGQIATLHPALSPMLWTSIATGKRPFKHGIHGFTEPAPDGRGIQAVTNLSRKAKALWNILHQNDSRSIVIGWWPSHPAEPISRTMVPGVMVSDQFHRVTGPVEDVWPMLANSVHPPELAETIAGLRVHPDSLTPEIVEPFVPLAREIDQDSDKRLALLLRTLAECLSVHATAMWLVENRPWDFCTIYHDAIDHFCHGFMRYHPPRQSWIRERDFELYKSVVSQAYQLHDRMLGELLDRVNDDTTVILISDHGFHPDHLRPASIPDIPAGPAIEHRDFGIFAMAGPRVKRAEPIYGVSLLDIAPTILTIFELPLGEDMDGRPLLQAFAEPPSVEFIPSWEDVPGDDGSHPPHTRQDPVAAHAALEQMIALGYIERPDENHEVAVLITIRELRYNLGESYQDAGRHAEALEIFQALRAADPDDARFAVRLFVSFQALGMRDEMRRLIEDLEGRRPAPVVISLRAQLWLAEKRYLRALAALERIPGNRPGILLQRADLCLRLRRRDDARRFYEQAIEMDPDSVQAYVGLSRIALYRRDYEAAAHLALEAIERVHQDPVAHFLLGRALAGMHEYERAARAFRAAISFQPHFPQAHIRVANLLEHLGHSESANEHRRMAREIKRQQQAPAEIKDKTATMVHMDSHTSGDAPPLSESLVIVTGLPRSGTSMLMQMLTAGGLEIVADGIRAADDDNPRGYLELERVKELAKDAKWLRDHAGKAIKIIAPLLASLPPELPCRVILSDRDLEEVLDSQDQMLRRRRQPVPAPERRQLLKGEYAKILARVEALLLRRANTQLLVVKYRDTVSDPRATAERINRFLGGGWDETKMTAAVEPALHRNRATH